MDELRWIRDHLSEELPALIGGFVAYFLHEAHHKLFRRPTHFLLRTIFRKRA